LKESKLRDAPADVTVGRGSRSRDDKNDIKNGASASSFTALSALFDVSLCFDLSDQTDSKKTWKPLRHALASVGRKKMAVFLARACLQHSNSRETPQDGNDVLGKFVYHLLRVLRRRLRRLDILRQNRRNLEIKKKDKQGKRTDVS